MPPTTASRIKVDLRHDPHLLETFPHAGVRYGHLSSTTWWCSDPPEAAIVTCATNGADAFCVVTPKKGR
jgi:hypothetical protein